MSVEPAVAASGWNSSASTLNGQWKFKQASNRKLSCGRLSATGPEASPQICPGPFVTPPPGLSTPAVAVGPFDCEVAESPMANRMRAASGIVKPLLRSGKNSSAVALALEVKTRGRAESDELDVDEPVCAAAGHGTKDAASTRPAPMRHVLATARRILVRVLNQPPGGHPVCASGNFGTLGPDPCDLSPLPAGPRLVEPPVEGDVAGVAEDQGVLDRGADPPLLHGRDRHLAQQVVGRVAVVGLGIGVDLEVVDLEAVVVAQPLVHELRVAGRRREPLTGPAERGETLLVGAAHVEAAREHQPDRLRDGPVAHQLVVGDAHHAGPLDLHVDVVAVAGETGLVGEV